MGIVNFISNIFTNNISENKKLDKKEEIINNDFLISLTELASEEGETGNLIRFILNLDKPERIIFLRDIEMQISTENTPDDFLNAIKLLYNDEIIGIIKQILKDRGTL